MATIRLPNGDRYIGEIQDGQFVGVGTLEFFNGDKYVGEFRDNCYHGHGVLTYANVICCQFRTTR